MSLQEHCIPIDRGVHRREPRSLFDLHRRELRRFQRYPDCTPQFIEAFQRVLDVGTKAGIEGRAIKIEAPLLRLSKTDIVREATRLKVPLELTWSCYEGGEKACGRCDSCQLRRRGFSEAGLKDPIEYEVK